MAYLCISMILAVSASVIYSIVNACFIGSLNNTAMLSAIAIGLPILG